MTRKYGYKKSQPPPNAWRAAKRFAAAPPPPPRASIADRSGGALGVLNQMRSDCVANAVMGALQVCMTKPGGALAPLGSRDWLYYLSGVPTHDQLNDDGRYIHNAFEAIRVMGWPDETVWPYGRWPEHPGHEADREAYHRRQIAFHYCSDEPAQRRLEIMQAIAHDIDNGGGFPVVFGVQVFADFENQDGITACHLNTAQEILGGHALRALAYDEYGVKGANSWGIDWANEGWFYLSWDYMLSGYASELVVVELLPEAA